MKYEVIVGNIGTVYSGGSRKEADRKFEIYREQSESGTGRAGDEDVTMMRGDEILREFQGRRSRLRDYGDLQPYTTNPAPDKKTQRKIEALKRRAKKLWSARTLSPQSWQNMEANHLWDEAEKLERGEYQPNPRQTPRQREVRKLFQRYHGQTGGIVGRAAQAAHSLAIARRMLDRAVDLGRAEIIWEVDQDADTSWVEQDGFERDRELLENGYMDIECCRIEIDGRTCASLCGISTLNRNAQDRAEANRYRDMVEAELAEECLPELQRVTRMR